MNLDIDSFNERLKLIENFMYQKWALNARTEMIEWNDYTAKDFRFQVINDATMPQPTTAIAIKEIKDIFERPIIIHPENILFLPNLTNSVVNLDLSKYFRSYYGDLPIEYVLLSDVSSFSNNYNYEFGDTPIYPTKIYEGSTVLSSSNITIIPDYRGQRYKLSITAINDIKDANDASFFGNVFYIDILEDPLPPLLRSQSRIEVVFDSNIPIEYNVSDLFTQTIDDSKERIRLEFDTSNLSQYSDLSFFLDSNVLRIEPDFRGVNGSNITYDIMVTCQNNIYKEAYNSVIFSVTEPPPIYKLISQKTLYGYDSVISINISDLFKTNTDVEFNVSTSLVASIDLRSNLIDHSFIIQDIQNNLIHLYPDYRGTYINGKPNNISYEILVVAEDPLYFDRPAKTSLTVFEIPPPIPIMPLGKVIDLGTLSNVQIECNLYEFFESSTKNNELRFVPAIDYSLAPTNQKKVFHIVDSNLTINALALNIANQPAPLYYSVYAIDTVYSVSSIETNPSNFLQFKLQESIIKSYIFFANGAPSLIAINPDHPLTNTEYTFNISSFYNKLYPELNVQGRIKNAYVSSSRTMPRDGIYNNRTYNNSSFDYLGNITDGVLTIYPDYRGLNYVLEIDVWLQGYSLPQWILSGSTFVVSELPGTINITDFFVDMTIVSLTYNMYDVYPVPYPIDNNQYDIPRNPFKNIIMNNNQLTVVPNCRGEVGIESGGELYIGSRLFYGLKASYNISIAFKTNITLEFTVVEQPPFYVDSDFYGLSGMTWRFESNIPYTFESLTYLLYTHTDLPFRFSCNLYRLYDSDGKPVRASSIYESHEAFTVDESGGVTVYPDFRNTTYAINITAYLDGFSSKVVEMSYVIEEGPIPPIINTSPLLRHESLLVDAQIIDLSQHYTYMYSQHLNYSISGAVQSNSMYHISNSLLYITPYARGINYELVITASDLGHNNHNSDLRIEVVESRYLDFVDKTTPINIPIIISQKPLRSQYSQYSLDVSSYYTRAFDTDLIKGAITGIYNLDQGIKPRVGIFNYRGDNSNVDYIVGFDNSILTIYPDFRESSYIVEADLWLAGYSKPEWILHGTRFLVTEYQIPTVVHSYNALTSIDTTVDLKSLTPQDVSTLNLAYDMIAPSFNGTDVATLVDGSNVLIAPRSRGVVYDIWLQSYDKVTDEVLFRIKLEIQELNIPMKGLSFSTINLFQQLYVIDLFDYIIQPYNFLRFIEFNDNKLLTSVSDYVSYRVTNKRYLQIMVYERNDNNNNVIVLSVVNPILQSTRLINISITVNVVGLNIVNPRYDPIASCHPTNLNTRPTDIIEPKPDLNIPLLKKSIVVGPFMQQVYFIDLLSFIDQSFAYLDYIEFDENPTITNISSYIEYVFIDKRYVRLFIYERDDENTNMLGFFVKNAALIKPRIIDFTITIDVYYTQAYIKDEPTLLLEPAKVFRGLGKPM